MWVHSVCPVRASVGLSVLNQTGGSGAGVAVHVQPPANYHLKANPAFFLRPTMGSDTIRPAQIKPTAVFVPQEGALNRSLTCFLTSRLGQGAVWHWRLALGPIPSTATNKHVKLN